MTTVETRSYHHPQILGSNLGSAHDLNEAQAVRDHYNQLIKQAEALMLVLK
jgi:hypothetical protein